MVLSSVFECITAADNICCTVYRIKLLIFCVKRGSPVVRCTAYGAIWSCSSPPGVPDNNLLLHVIVILLAISDDQIYSLWLQDIGLLLR